MKTTGKSINNRQHEPHLNNTNFNLKLDITSNNTFDFKLLIVTWNMMGKLPSQKTLEILLPPQRTSAHIIIIGTQECQNSLLMSFFCKSKTCWQNMLCQYLRAKKYKMIQSQKLHGLHLIAFVKQNKEHFVSCLKSKRVKTGWYGFMGNKGAVSLNLMIGGQSFLFINTHLPSDHNDCSARNDHLIQIVDEHINKDKKQNIIFFGDMNYRLNVSGDESRRLCAMNLDKQLNYQDFVQKDQLTQQKQLQFFLKLFQQQNISFPPTYKLSTEDNTYDNNRITGWTDRIFYQSGSTSQLTQDSYYSQMYVLGSDHRPVFGQFSINVDPNITSNQRDRKNQKTRKCLFF